VNVNVRVLVAEVQRFSGSYDDHQPRTIRGFAQAHAHAHAHAHEHVNVNVNVRVLVAEVQRFQRLV
jgi:hypothetical protein